MHIAVKSMLTVAALAAAGLMGASHAQTPEPPPMPMPGHGRTVASHMMPGASHTVEVSVNYGLSIPIKADDPEAQAQALESARRALYAIASKECTLLLDSIASACQLVRLNVQSNIQRHQPAQPTAHVGANASYRVTMK